MDSYVIVRTPSATSVRLVKETDSLPNVLNASSFTENNLTSGAVSTSSPSNSTDQLRSGSGCADGDIGTGSTTRSEARRKFVCKAFRPLFLIVRLFGLYVPDFETPRWQRLFWSLYATLVVVAVWLNAFRYFMIYSGRERFSNKLLFKTLFQLTMLKFACGYTIFYVQSLRQGWTKAWWTYPYQLIRQVLVAWEQAFLDSGGDVDYNFRKLRRLINIFTCVGFFCILFTFAAIYCKIMWFWREEHLPNHARYFFPMVSYFGAAGEFFMAGQFLFLAGSWVWPNILLLILAFGTRAQILTINQRFKVIARNKGDNWIEVFLIYARQHLRYLKLLRAADKLYSTFLLLVYIAEFPSVCLALYCMVFHTGDTRYLVKQIATILFFLMILAELYLVTLSCARLNHTACHGKHYVYALLHWSDCVLDSTAGAKINSFLARLNSGQIGFTAGRIFYIDKSTLTMLTTVIFTYAILMLRLGKTFDSDQAQTDKTSTVLVNGLECAPCVCNGTGLVY